MNGITLTKIPEPLLGKFKCSQCAWYLSVGPIGIRADGQGICGRCIDWGATPSVVFARCKFFEELASLHTFPCRYQPQGCLEYLPFNKALEHENKCPRRPCLCPLSACYWDGPVPDLRQHFMSDHRELYLKTANFRLNLKEDYETHNMIEINNIAILLQIKCCTESGQVWFNAICTGNEGSELLIKYKIKLYDNDNERVMKLEYKHPLPGSHLHLLPAKCTGLDIDPLLTLLQSPKFIQCEWHFTVTD